MKNTNAIHSLGNGHFLLYGQGPDITAMHAGDYSSPSAGSLVLDGCTGYDIPSRKLGTWNSTAHTEGGAVCFEDTLDPYSNTFVRRIRSDCDARLSLYTHPDGKAYSRGNGTVVILPRGTMYFTSIVTAREYRLYISCGGCASIDGTQISVAKGEGYIRIFALRLDTDNAYHTDSGENSDIESVKRNSDGYWRSFFDRIKYYPGIENVEESVAYTIKTQQSRDGGIAAGHFYPMAYVRDQAGTARGLLALGLVDEAKAVVGFWNEKFKRYGDIHNAETMGNSDGRLVFSNDEVEVPAYVMLTAFFCAEADGNIRWLEALKPMLEYAAHVQCRHIAHGMTGFSGDETYIAGGMFPRCFLYHGSAESTMLFITSVERYIRYFGADEELSAALNEAKDKFRENFVIGGKLYANQPSREQYAVLPRFHFGYCDYCELAKNPAQLTWLERRDDGLYAAPDYFDAPEIPIPESIPRLLGSVSLSVFWHGFDILTEKEKEETIKPFLTMLETRGSVYSSPDGETATGYDYAYLLEALVKTDSPRCADMLEKTLDVLDESGSWSEYYRNGVPYNCRNRPWESGINISAVIDAVKHLNNKGYAE